MSAFPASVADVPAAPPDTDPVTYPEGDGKPMAETGIHVNQILYLYSALQTFFAAAPSVYVGANMLLYYIRGNPRRSVAPDVFVTRGIAKYVRRTYKVWEEGKPPDVVFEVTSASTRREDTGRKRDLYLTLGVAEYFLFDPEGDYLTPPLQGYRLVDGEYVPVAPSAGDVMRSEVLGLDLRLHAGGLRLWDPARERWLLGFTGGIDPADEASVLGRLSRPVESATSARVAALEAELAQLRALLDQEQRQR